MLMTISRLALLLVAPAAATFPANASKYLLLDDRNIIEASAKITLGAVEKSKSNPMIKEEREWEMRIDNGQPNVWYDPELGKWRAWYSAFTSCGLPIATVPYCQNHSQTCGTVSKDVEIGRGTGLLYAESKDGLAWTKPDLGLVEWKGSKKNNLLKQDPKGENGGMTTGIYLDERPTTPKAERYKIVTGSNGLGSVAVSHDGLLWNRSKDLEKQTYGRWDTPKNVVWDEPTGQWILYNRLDPTVYEPNAAGMLRVQAYTHSVTDDFLGDWAWTAPTGLNSSKDYAPDGLVVWPYEGIYLGIGNVFNPMQVTGRVPIGQVNAVLAWSADGRRWKWVKPNDSLIPQGGANDFDACGIFGAKQDPLRMAKHTTPHDDDHLRLYYVGCNGPFFGSRGCGMGMASIMRDGFAGYTGGSVVTAPVRVSGDGKLRITIDGGAKGGVRVGVVDSPELSFATCRPMLGKGVDVVVEWVFTDPLPACKPAGPRSCKLEDYLHGAVMLEFFIPDDAIVFAYAI